MPLSSSSSSSSFSSSSFAGSKSWKDQLQNLDLYDFIPTIPDVGILSYLPCLRSIDSFSQTDQNVKKHQKDNMEGKDDHLDPLGLGVDDTNEKGAGSAGKFKDFKTLERNPTNSYWQGPFSKRLNGNAYFQHHIQSLTTLKDVYSFQDKFGEFLEVDKSRKTSRPESSAPEWMLDYFTPEDFLGPWNSHRDLKHIEEWSTIWHYAQIKTLDKVLRNGKTREKAATAVAAADSAEIGSELEAEIEAEVEASEFWENNPSWHAQFEPVEALQDQPMPEVAAQIDVLPRHWLNELRANRIIDNESTQRALQALAKRLMGVHGSLLTVDLSSESEVSIVEHIATILLQFSNCFEYKQFFRKSWVLIYHEICTWFGEERWELEALHAEENQDLKKEHISNLMEKMNGLKTQIAYLKERLGFIEPSVWCFKILLVASPTPVWENGGKCLFLNTLRQLGQLLLHIHTMQLQLLQEDKFEPRLEGIEGDGMEEITGEKGVWSLAKVEKDAFAACQPFREKKFTFQSTAKRAEDEGGIVDLEGAPDAFVEGEEGVGGGGGGGGRRGAGGGGGGGRGGRRGGRGGKGKGKGKSREERTEEEKAERLEYFDEMMNWIAKHGFIKHGDQYKIPVFIMIDEKRVNSRFYKPGASLDLLVEDFAKHNQNFRKQIYFVTMMQKRLPLLQDILNRFVEGKKSRHHMSFLDCIVNLENGDVISYEDYERYGEPGLMTLKLIQSKYNPFPMQRVVSLVGDAYAVPTQHFDRIFNVQDTPLHPRRWYFVCWFRIYYDVGSTDNWQFQIILWGASNAGKSLLITIAIETFEIQDIRIINDAMEANFPLQDLYDGMVIFGTEIGPGLKYTFPQTIWQLAVSGEANRVNRKSAKSISNSGFYACWWLCMNVVFPYFKNDGMNRERDDHGQVRRRNVIFKFFYTVYNMRTALLTLIQTFEYPSLFFKGTLLHWLGRAKYSKVGIWSALDNYFHIVRKQMIDEASDIRSFLLSGTVIYHHSYSIPFVELSKAYTSWKRQTDSKINDLFTAPRVKEFFKDYPKFGVTMKNETKKQWMGFDLETKTYTGLFLYGIGIHDSTLFSSSSSSSSSSSPLSSSSSSSSSSSRSSPAARSKPSLPARPKARRLTKKPTHNQVDREMFQ